MASHSLDIDVNPRSTCLRQGYLVPFPTGCWEPRSFGMVCHPISPWRVRWGVVVIKCLYRPDGIVVQKNRESANDPTVAGPCVGVRQQQADRQPAVGLLSWKSPS